MSEVSQNGTFCGPRGVLENACVFGLAKISDFCRLCSAQYRHSMLEPIKDSLESCFRAVCDEYDYEILSLHISPDHVHLFVSAHPKWFER